MADVDVRCPHCGQRRPWQDNPYRPFCSKRCRLLDLDAWVSEEYAIGEAADVAEQTPGREYEEE